MNIIDSGRQISPSTTWWRVILWVREMASLMLRMCKPIVGTGKDMILGSSFYVDKGIIEL